MAARREEPRQLAVVVDLTIEDHPDAPVLVAHWLVTGREVDDLEPAHREPDRPLDEESLVVGAAVGDPVVHALEDHRIGSPVGARQHVADDAAHGRYAFPSSPTVSRT